MARGKSRACSTQGPALGSPRHGMKGLFSPNERSCQAGTHPAQPHCSSGLDVTAQVDCPEQDRKTQCKIPLQCRIKQLKTARFAWCTLGLGKSMTVINPLQLQYCYLIVLSSTRCLYQLPSEKELFSLSNIYFTTQKEQEKTPLSA